MMTRNTIEDFPASFELDIDQSFNQAKAIHRVNRLALESKANQSDYAE